MKKNFPILMEMLANKNSDPHKRRKYTTYGMCNRDSHH